MTYCNCRLILVAFYYCMICYFFTISDLGFNAGKKCFFSSSTSSLRGGRNPKFYEFSSLLVAALRNAQNVAKGENLAECEPQIFAEKGVLPSDSLLFHKQNGRNSYQKKSSSSISAQRGLHPHAVTHNTLKLVLLLHQLVNSVLSDENDTSVNKFLEKYSKNEELAAENSQEKICRHKDDGSTHCIVNTDIATEDHLLLDNSYKKDAIVEYISSDSTANTENLYSNLPSSASSKYSWVSSSKKPLFSLLFPCLAAEFFFSSFTSSGSLTSSKYSAPSERPAVSESPEYTPFVESLESPVLSPFPASSAPSPPPSHTPPPSAIPPSFPSSSVSPPPPPSTPLANSITSSYLALFTTLPASPQENPLLLEKTALKGGVFPSLNHAIFFSSATHDTSKELFPASSPHTKEASNTLHTHSFSSVFTLKALLEEYFHVLSRNIHMESDENASSFPYRAKGLSSGLYFVLGIILNLFSAFFGASGDILVRKYHLLVKNLKNKEKAHENRSTDADSNLYYEERKQSTANSLIGGIFEDLEEENEENHSFRSLMPDSCYSAIREPPGPSYFLFEGSSCVNADSSTISIEREELGDEESDSFGARRKDFVFAYSRDDKRDSMDHHRDTPKIAGKRSNFEYILEEDESSLPLHTSEVAKGYNEGDASACLIEGCVAKKRRFYEFLCINRCFRRPNSCNLRRLKLNLLWLSGILCIATLCPLTNVCAIFYLPPNLSGLSTLQIFFTMFLARIFLQERMPLWNYLGVVFIVPGLFLVASASVSMRSEVSDFEELIKCISSLQSVILLSVMGGLLIISYSFYFDISEGYRAYNLHRIIQMMLMPTAIGLCGAFAGIGVKALDLSLAGYISKKVPVSRLFRHPTPILLLVVTVGFAMMELIFLNKSLEKNDAVVVVAINNAVQTVLGGLGGMLVFKDYPSMPTFWAIGLVCVVLGVIGLSGGTSVVSVCKERFRMLLSKCVRTFRWRQRSSHSVAVDSVSLGAALVQSRSLQG